MTRNRDDRDDRSDHHRDEGVSEMGYEYGASGRVYPPDYGDEQEAHPDRRKGYPANAWSWQDYGDGDRGGTREAQPGRRKDYPVNAWSWQDYGDRDRGDTAEAREGRPRSYPANAWTWQDYGDGQVGPGRLVYVADPGGMPSHRGKGPRGYQRSDERIHEEVSDALADEHAVDASDVMVQVQDGEVTLSGTVTDRQQKRLAEDCAAQVRGVKDVHNRLRVQRQD